MNASEGQNIFDIVNQAFGGLDYLFDFLNDNGLSPNSELVPGQILVINNTGKGNEKLKSFAANRGLKYNNGESKERLINNIRGDFSLIDYNDDYFK